MSHTPETQEAVERWRQGKINIFDEMARLERERNKAQANLREAVSLISDRVKCDDFHHEKCDRHMIGEPCPIVFRFKTAVKRLEEVAYE